MRDQARGQDGWILAKFSFCVFMDRDEENEANISSHLDRTSLVNKIILVLDYFRALKRKPVICKCDVLFSLFSFSLTLSVFSFSSSIPTEKSQKIFLLPRKIFCKRKLSCTRLDFGEILLREQNGQSRAGSIGPSCPLG